MKYKNNILCGWVSQKEVCVNIGVQEKAPGEVGERVMWTYLLRWIVLASFFIISALSLIAFVIVCFLILQCDRCEQGIISLVPDMDAHWGEMIL